MSSTPIDTDTATLIYYQDRLDAVATRALLTDLLCALEVLQPGTVHAMRHRRLMSLKEAEAGMSSRPDTGLNPVDVIKAELDTLAVVLGEDGSAILFAPAAGRA